MIIKKTIFFPLVIRLKIKNKINKNKVTTITIFINKFNKMKIKVKKNNCETNPN